MDSLSTPIADAGHKKKQDISVLFFLGFDNSGFIRYENADCHTRDRVPSEVNRFFIESLT